MKQKFDELLDIPHVKDLYKDTYLELNFDEFTLILQTQDQNEPSYTSEISQ